MRIIAGQYRGRRIAFPSRAGLRPTPDRVRETLFNWLGQWLDGQRCLDLFAGSGALGFEAASRGARSVVLVENDREVAAHLEAAREAIGAAQVEVVRADARDYLSRGGEPFDVVFLDPPFRQNAVPELLAALPPRLSSGARVYAESGAAVEPPLPWRVLRSDRAGQVHFQLLQWRGDDQGGVRGNV
ncbi:MAG: 16S rRNA (guanine(966)-N(2))-methyltransferase RsmD [Betaproteobacteria bacterium]